MLYYGIAVLALGAIFFFSGFQKLWKYRNGRGRISGYDYKNVGIKTNLGVVLFIVGILIIVGSFF